VVQLRIHDRVGDVTRPVKELKGFKKITIRKGEKIKVSFRLIPDDLSYYHEDMTFTFDPGEFELYISHNSADKNYVVFTIRKD
jgi:beta-glucosidase